jgi:pimeloyl-ACP methyl ester carboxylesterase
MGRDQPPMGESMSAFQSHYITANAIRMHYWREGRGPTLLLLHGWPEFCRTWRRVIPLLASEFDLIAPDLRGFGETEKPDPGPTDAMTVDVLAEDMLAFLDALGLDRPVGFVSHDVGAYVTQALVRRWPARAAGLFFFNCPYPGIGRRWAEPEHLKEIWYQSFHQMPFAANLVGFSRETCRLYIGHFLRHWSGDPHAFDEDLEAWIDNFMKPGNLQGGFNWYSGARRARVAVMRGETPPVPPIEAPTRVHWGGRDPIIKAEWMDRLPEFFTNLEASVAPDAGHFVKMEQPELAAEEIRKFFERVMAR